MKKYITVLDADQCRGTRKNDATIYESAFIREHPRPIQDQEFRLSFRMQCDVIIAEISVFQREISRKGACTETSPYDPRITGITLITHVTQFTYKQVLLTGLTGLTGLFLKPVNPVNPVYRVFPLRRVSNKFVLFVLLADPKVSSCKQLKRVDHLEMTLERKS